MRRILIGLALIFVALPASGEDIAQEQKKLATQSSAEQAAWWTEHLAGWERAGMNREPKVICGTVTVARFNTFMRADQLPNLTGRVPNGAFLWVLTCSSGKSYLALEAPLGGSHGRLLITERKQY